MLRLVKTLYTLVRHSGYTGGRNPQFMNAVELQSISEKDAARVRKVGGLVFDSYEEANGREYDENYPANHVGMVPKVRGSFVRRAGIGEIYIPPKAEAA